MGYLIGAMLVLPVLGAFLVIILESGLEAYEEMKRMTPGSGRKFTKMYDDKGDPWYVGYGD